MISAEREAAVAELLIAVAAALDEGAAMALAQRESSITLLTAYQRVVGDRAPVHLAEAALHLVDNAGHLAVSLERLAGRVGSLARQWPKGGGQ